VDLAAETLTEKLSSGVRSLNSALNGSILLYLTSPRLCAVALSVVPLVGVGAMTLSKHSSLLAKKVRALQSEVLSYSLERVSNISTVKVGVRIR
jgi:ABC-type bacteriocin/lantibiotic exporter with double-glycine peptidase domain